MMEWMEIKELCRQALKLGMNDRKINDIRRQIAEVYKRYLNSLPEERRNDSVVILGRKVIPREKIPEVLLTDDDFFILFIKVHGR